MKGVALALVLVVVTMMLVTLGGLAMVSDVPAWLVLGAVVLYGAGVWAVVDQVRRELE